MAERRRRTAPERIGVRPDTADSAQIAGLSYGAGRPEAMVDGRFEFDGLLHGTLLAEGTGEHRGVTGKIERAPHRDGRAVSIWRKSLSPC